MLLQYAAAAYWHLCEAGSRLENSEAAGCLLREQRRPCCFFSSGGGGLGGGEKGGSG